MIIKYLHISLFLYFILALKAVSMGQGQEVVARDMIESSIADGGWVLLQNIHLSLPFATEIMAMMIENETKHETFRLWLTTEVHELFPIGLLQMAIKYTNEPPQGIRASLKRTYQNITQDYLDYSAQQQWPPLLYAVAFLHTVVQERRKFGPLGIFLGIVEYEASCMSLQDGIFLMNSINPILLRVCNSFRTI